MEQGKGSDPAYPPAPPPQATYSAGQGQPPPAYAPQQPAYPQGGPAQGGYPQGGYPQGGYPQQPGGATVIVTQPTSTTMVVNNMMFREAPVNTVCPSCQKQIITSTSYETGTMTWVACLVLFFIGCDLGCCFIPFCVGSCKDVVHTCPNCNALVGKFNRM